MAVHPSWTDRVTGHWPLNDTNQMTSLGHRVSRFQENVSVLDCIENVLGAGKQKPHKLNLTDSVTHTHARTHRRVRVHARTHTHIYIYDCVGMQSKNVLEYWKHGEAIFKYLLNNSIHMLNSSFVSHFVKKIKYNW